MVKMIIPSVVFAVMLVAPPQALHIDYDAPVLPATQHEPPYYPLVCDSTMVNVVQFQWLALPDEATDHDAIESELRQIAEHINWLFWRDSDNHAEVRIPAWKVTVDCKLDIRWHNEPFTGRIPPHGQTKLIQISPDTNFCGYAYVNTDDQPGPTNLHNLSSMAVVARQCLGHYVVAHEFLHSIGAVRPSAPHSDGNLHSTEFDIMGPPGAPDCTIHDRIDCNHDDYFSLSPGERFTNRWNSADSIFLVSIKRQVTWVPIAVRYK